MQSRLGRGMQWYVYLITIPAAAFLVQVAAELVSRPIREVVRLRRTALERVRSFRNISLPRPRELAISSREIREYDQAVRNARAAQRTFGDLGAQLLVFSENEPAVRMVMAWFGVNIAQAGRELINLSEIYASAKTDSDELRREIEKAFRATRAALAAFRRPSRDALIRIRLEPMYPLAACAPSSTTKPVARGLSQGLGGSPLQPGKRTLRHCERGQPRATKIRPRRESLAVLRSFTAVREATPQRAAKSP